MILKRGELFFDGIQFKSLEKCKKFSSALNVIEEECGIHEVNIVFGKKIFVCPWIDLDKLNSTPMEELVCGLLRKVIKL